MVTRRYLRSGESEYLINGVTCRSRDITELFSARSWSKAYAIIEQGRVEALISAKPEELRLFIEEAQETRLTVQSSTDGRAQMERTRENLLPRPGILREVERQLASLRRTGRGEPSSIASLMAEIKDLDVALSAASRAHDLAENCSTSAVTRSI